MKGEATKSIYQAMGINLLVTALALVAGVVLDAPGIQMAAVALTVAMLAELVFLRQRAKRAVIALQTGFPEPA
jgi:FtsH-binding integral membrane protein